MDTVMERNHILEARGAARAAQSVALHASPAHARVTNRSDLPDRPTYDSDSNEDAAVARTLRQGTRSADDARLERSTVVFGPFRLRAAERLLEKDGLPVRVGSRALDILIALVDDAPDVVGKRDLIKRVWGGLVVDDGSLRYHIVALRKALGDGRCGARYITNVAGRGYCFVAPISRSLDRRNIHEGERIERHFLPAPVHHLIGRDDAIRTVLVRLKAQRFVTLVGPAGVGKTAVAVQVAHSLLAEFDGEVHFVDLGALAPAASVCDALASMLGLALDREASLPHLLARLRKRRILLILDNCEHVIESVAELADQLFRAAPQIHILATSRESLRIPAERVIPLAPLGYPPASEGLTAAEALRYPAVQLFVQLIAMSVPLFELGDAEAPPVCSICRRLDGIPLALELTAGRVAIHGIRGTAALLDNLRHLLWPGRRTRLPRHRTLYATLEWSYALLSDLERLALRRLSAIDGPFCLESAEAAAGNRVDGEPLVEILARLAEKSVVAVDVTATPPQYRLLEVTRAYLMQTMAERDAAPGLEYRRSITGVTDDALNARRPCVESVFSE